MLQSLTLVITCAFASLVHADVDLSFLIAKPNPSLASDDPIAFGDWVYLSPDRVGIMHVEFDANDAGGSSDVVIAVLNGGDSAVGSLNARAPAAPFSFKGGAYPGAGGSCDAGLDAQSACTVVLSYTPGRTRRAHALLEFDFADGSRTHRAYLILHGPSAKPASAPVTSDDAPNDASTAPAVAPASLSIGDGPTFDFGVVATGSSNDHTFIVTNGGGVAATAIEGSLAPPFHFKGHAFPGTGGTCTATMNPGGSCTVVVEYDPTSTGSHDATLTFTYSDGVAAQAASRTLTGTAGAPAMISIGDGPAYDFGGATAAEHTFTISNTGTLAATSIGAGDLAAPFAFKDGAFPGVGGTCGVSLAPGDTCSVVVSFTPAASGSFTSTLTLTYFDGASVQSAARSVQGAMNATEVPDAPVVKSDLQRAARDIAHDLDVTSADDSALRRVAELFAQIKGLLE